MADKEVQISKNAAASAVSSRKKTSTMSTKIPLDKPGSSTTQSSSKPSQKDSNGGKMNEVLELLRVLNSNVNAQNARLDKQEKCINDIMNEWPVDGQHDIDVLYEQDECEGQFQCESFGESFSDTTENQSKSIFMKLFVKFQQSELVDADVHSDLANLVNSSFRNGLSEENLEEILKQIHRPQNCDSLVKKRVNQSIWQLLKSFTQAEDSRLSSLQGVILKASVNVVKLVEKLGTAESETDSEHVELGTTAIALLGHANKMINSKRKELHKSDLDYKSHYLTSASLPYTDLLYGNDNDVNNNVREINNMNRIGKATGRGGGLMRGRGRRGFNPYSSRGRGFRGRGGFPACTESQAVTKNGKFPQKKGKPKKLNLLQKLIFENRRAVIEEVCHHPNEYISPIFVIPKRSGEYRMILNLKNLNKYVEYHHFKMDTFESALKLVKTNMFFASTDIRHGYYSLPIAVEDQVKLRFIHLGKIYQYRALPNGISSAPKQFTKMMKPVYASLRMMGHKNSGYIDDSLLMGDTYSDTVNLMMELGFMIHETKSVMVPTRKITFLGYDIN
ncbi:YG31B-like protein [Mya arenaria]|uniref:YG31B-like protein n=1 Tax=Mya arenaria TaxID=6604 RepID=A0ABY7FCV4_MYAAR|nr:YG31B-like protein [Mya arenaria]